MAFVDLGTLKVGVTVDGESAKKGFNDVKNQSKQAADDISVDWNKVASNLNTVGSNMTKYLTLPILAIAAASVKLASDMEETNNKIDATFKDSADTVKAWASTSIESMGMAKQTALDAAAVFGDMGTGMGQTTVEAAHMSTSLVQLAADMASFKNISIDRAKVALQGVYTGETEALKGLGIVMTEANLEQFAMAQGITNTYKEMSQSEKVMLRYQYVMSVTNNAQGDFARTSGGLANQSRMLKENLKELGVQFGNVLLPIINKVVGGINDFLKSLQDLSPEQQQTIVTIGLIVAAIGPLLVGIGKAISAYQAIKTAVVAANIEMNATMGVIGLVVLAIGGLIALISSWHQHQEELAKHSQERLNKILEESAAKFNEVAAAETVATEETQTLTDKLKQLAETNPDIAVLVETDEATVNVEELKEALGRLITNSGKLKENIEDVNEALLNHANALKAARYADMIDDIFTIIPLMQEQGKSTAEITAYVNEAIAGYNAYSDAIDSTSDATGQFAEAMKDGKLTTEELIPIISGLASVTDGLYNSIETTGEGIGILNRAFEDGTINQAGYQAVAQQTAELLTGEVLGAVNQVTNAYTEYDAAEARADATAEAARANVQGQIDAINSKLPALEQYVNNLMLTGDEVEALQLIEQQYCAETAAAIKAAMDNKEGSFSSMADKAIALTEEWTSDVKTYEAALAKDTGIIDSQRKDTHITNAQQLASKLNGITSGWTTEEISQFAKLAKSAGFELDTGFLNMLTANNNFITDMKTKTAEGAEFVPEEFRTQLSKLIPIIQSNAKNTTSSSKGIGEGVSDGVAVGIKNHEYKAINAAVAMVKAAIAAAKKAGDINSPSKETEKGVGKELAAGVGVGWDNEIKNVTKKVQVGIENITVGSSASVNSKIRETKSSYNGMLANAIKSLSNIGTSNNKVEQNNYFQSKPLTPYEQILQARRLNKELARAMI